MTMPALARISLNCALIRIAPRSGPFSGRSMIICRQHPARACIAPGWRVRVFAHHSDD